MSPFRDPTTLVLALAASLSLAGCAPRERPAAAPAQVISARAAASWRELRERLPGTWQALSPGGKVITESFRLISNDSALVETFVTPSGRETMSVYHPDRDSLMLTHYCGQGNQPRLRAVAAPGEGVVFRFADATNELPGQDLLVEKTVRFREGGLEQTEVYRKTDGELERTVLRFTRVK